MEIFKVEFVPGDPSALRLDGEIDLSTADQLRAAVEKALSMDPNVVIDMAGVSFIDACGLRVVLQLAASRDGAGPLQLVNACRVARILNLVGLSDLPSIVIRDVGDAGGR